MPLHVYRADNLHLRRRHIDRRSHTTERRITSLVGDLPRDDTCSPCLHAHLCKRQLPGLRRPGQARRDRGWCRSPFFDHRVHCPPGRRLQPHNHPVDPGVRGVGSLDVQRQIAVVDIIPPLYQCHPSPDRYRHRRRNGWGYREFVAVVVDDAVAHHCLKQPCKCLRRVDPVRGFRVGGVKQSVNLSHTRFTTLSFCASLRTPVKSGHSVPSTNVNLSPSRAYSSTISTIRASIDAMSGYSTWTISPRSKSSP